MTSRGVYAKRRGSDDALRSTRHKRSVHDSGHSPIELAIADQSKDAFDGFDVSPQSRASSQRSTPSASTHAHTQVGLSGPARVLALHQTFPSSVHRKDDQTTAPPTPATKTLPTISKLDLNILSVAFGRRIVTPWYPSLYREELLGGAGGGTNRVQRLYVCPWCFAYTVEAWMIVGHSRHCVAGLPRPGRNPEYSTVRFLDVGSPTVTSAGQTQGQIPPLAVWGKKKVYESGRYGLYELDGEEDTLFAQNLSLFAKLFIENKSVCFDVSNFLYYLLVDHYDSGNTVGYTKETKAQRKSQSKELHNGSNADAADIKTSIARPQIVGFFSKEKLSWDNNNLACILVFPPWQRMGLGHLLIGASYELGKREGRLGGPERPLSKPGAQSYLQFWSRAAALAILGLPPNRSISVQELSQSTYITVEDLLAGLDHLGVAGALRKRKDGTLMLDKGLLRDWINVKGLSQKPIIDVDAFLEAGETLWDESEDNESEDDSEDN